MRCHPRGDPAARRRAARGPGAASRRSARALQGETQ